MHDQTIATPNWCRLYTALNVIYMLKPEVTICTWNTLWLHVRSTTSQLQHAAGQLWILDGLPFLGADSTQVLSGWASVPGPVRHLSISWLSSCNLASWGTSGVSEISVSNPLLAFPFETLTSVTLFGGWIGACNRERWTFTCCLEAYVIYGTRLILRWQKTNCSR